MKNINDFQKELLFLLEEIDTICTKNNINYSLFGGTMIGAIRHKGFIPWDDDADIIFERSEYEKFINVLPEDFSIFNLLWVPCFKHNNNPEVFIDIFVFDVTTNSKKSQKIQILGLKAIQGTLKNQITTNKGTIGTIISFCTYIIGFILSQKFKLKIYDKIAKVFKHKKSDYVFSSLDQYSYIGNVLPKTILNSYKKVDFEDTQLMIMEGYDLYLKKFYGDYMKLPPEKDQRPEHGNLSR